MSYVKPPLTLDQQADLLIQRGMTGNRELMIERLRMVNYYRLSGYWYPFRNFPDDTFKPGTSFDVVLDRYEFDRLLRLLLMDAIERIEVAVRTQLAYHHAHQYQSPFAYADAPEALPRLPIEQRNRFLAKIKEETQKSGETFVEHFCAKYGEHHEYLPIWIAIEIMTFGSVLTFYRGAATEVRQSIAALFKVHDTVVESWLLTLNTIRNFCAHHARLWNRELGIKPLIPEKSPQWHVPVEITNNRVFGILTICRYCLECVAIQDQWVSRLKTLLAKHPDIPLRAMGFPDNWRECPIWRESGHGG